MPITPPTPTITPSASSTATNTEGVRGKPMRRSRLATGASRKLSSTASVTGISTSRARNSAPTTTTLTARVSRLFTPGTSAGKTWPGSTKPDTGGGGVKYTGPVGSAMLKYPTLLYKDARRAWAFLQETFAVLTLLMRASSNRERMEP